MQVNHGVTQKIKMFGSTVIKIGSKVELNLQTNEWPKIRTVGGELAIEKTKPKERKKKKKAVNSTMHTCKQNVRN